MAKLKVTTTRRGIGSSPTDRAATRLLRTLGDTQAGPTDLATATSLAGRVLAGLKDDPPRARELGGQLALLDMTRPEGPQAPPNAVLAGQLSSLFKGYADQLEAAPPPKLTRKAAILKALGNRPQRPTELADSLGMQTSHVSNALRTLVSEGKVTSRADPHDGRSTIYRRSPGRTA